MYIWLILGFVIILLMLQSFDFILFFVLTGFKLVAYIITGILELFAWTAYKLFNWKDCHVFFQELSAYIDDLGFEVYGVVHSAIQNTLLEYPILPVALALLALFGLSYFDTNL